MPEDYQTCEHDWFVTADGQFLICRLCKCRLDPTTEKILPPAQYRAPFVAEED